MQDKQASPKQHHDKRSKQRHFQSVLVENNRPEPKWVVGTILEKLGDISYQVQVGTQVHVDQMLQTTITQAKAETNDEITDDVNLWPLTLNDSLASHQPEKESQRYPTRVRYPPDRYSPSNY